MFLPKLSLTLTLLVGFLFAQDWQEVSLDNVSIKKENGIYTYTMNEKPMNGHFLIDGGAEKLKLHIADGLADGSYVELNSEGKPLVSYNFSKGLQHGEQIGYYQGTDQIMHRFSTCYGKLHGTAVEYEEDGSVKGQFYYVLNNEVPNQAAFDSLIQIYPCTSANVQLKLDLSTPKEDASIITLDTIKVEKGVNYLEGVFPASMFKTSAPGLDSIQLKLFTSNDRLLLLTVGYEAEDNEIAFFYGIDSLQRKRQQHFILGKTVKKALKNESLDPIEVIAFLEHRIFGVRAFSGMSAYGKLEKAINWKD